MYNNIDIEVIVKLIVTVLLIYFSVKVTSKLIKIILFILIIVFIINSLSKSGILNV